MVSSAGEGEDSETNGMYTLFVSSSNSSLTFYEPVTMSPEMSVQISGDPCIFMLTLEEATSEFRFLPSQIRAVLCLFFKCLSFA